MTPKGVSSQWIMGSGLLEPPVLVQLEPQYSLEIQGKDWKLVEFSNIQFSYLNMDIPGNYCFDRLVISCHSPELLKLSVSFYSSSSSIIPKLCTCPPWVANPTDKAFPSQCVHTCLDLVMILEHCPHILKPSLFRLG